MGEGSTFTLGMLVAFLAYRQYFTDAVVQLLEKGIEFNLLSLHLDRLSDIIFEETDADQSGDAQLKDLKGAVSLDGVSFRYSDTDPWVLTDFNLNIAAGEMVTLTGPSGGGKTTLMKLMLGLYDPVKGAVRIDGQDLREIDRANWRSQIGVVIRSCRVVSGSVYCSPARFIRTQVYYSWMKEQRIWMWRRKALLSKSSQPCQLPVLLWRIARPF